MLTGSSGLFFEKAMREVRDEEMCALCRRDPCLCESLADSAREDATSARKPPKPKGGARTRGRVLVRFLGNRWSVRVDEHWTPLESSRDFDARDPFLKADEVSHEVRRQTGGEAFIPTHVLIYPGESERLPVRLNGGEIGHLDGRIDLLVFARLADGLRLEEL